MGLVPPFGIWKTNLLFDSALTQETKLVKNAHFQREFALAGLLGSLRVHLTGWWEYKSV